ncbi:MAG: energy-coupled thiamine transporter ThiT [Roseburia sp.]|nr:energy-coupled thiamine transporter ThiT [Roseburia sp.]
MWEDVKNYFANFDGTVNTCRTMALWIAVALIVCFAAIKLYIFAVGKRRKYDADTLAAANRITTRAMIAAALVFAAAFIIAFSTCYFVDVSKGDDDLVPILFYPLLTLGVSAVASAAALYFKPVKTTKIICAAVCAAAAIAVIVCMSVHYARGDAGEVYGSVGLYISAIVLTAAVILFAFFADRRGGAFDTRTITFAAVCVALSFALSYVRIFKMPMGGSITLASMLPLMLYAFIFGCRRGILVGAVYGVLQAVQDPWIVHPAQFFLDYLLAFMSIGLTGCIKDLGLLKGKVRVRFISGAAIALLFRFLCHYFAGVFAFGSYGEFYSAEYNMPAISNAYVYSLVYQSLYLLPELAIVLAVSMIVFASKSFVRQVEMYSGRGERVGAIAADSVAEQPSEQDEVGAGALSDNSLGEPKTE